MLMREIITSAWGAAPHLPDYLAFIKQNIIATAINNAIVNHINRYLTIAIDSKNS